MINIFSGYTDSETAKLKKVISDLFLSIDPNKVTFVGSLPIRYFFELLRIPYKKGHLNDLDILLPSLSCIKENITDNFAVYHTHDYPNCRSLDFSFRFFAAMVHKKTGIKVDIFSDYPFKPIKTLNYDLNGSALKLQSAEDQLITQILEAELIMLEQENGRLDYKRRDIIRGLKKVVNFNLANEYWKTRDIKKNPRSLSQAIYGIESYIDKNGKKALKYLKKKHTKPCKICVDIKNLPLSSPEIANKYLFLD